MVTRMFYVLNENKEAIPATLDEWSNMFEHNDRSVAFDIIGDKEVSTVFLGNDHNYFGGAPLLFETMVFGEGGDSEHYQERYTTYAQAEEGHKRAIEWVKNGCKDE